MILYLPTPRIVRLLLCLMTSTLFCTVACVAQLSPHQLYEQFAEAYSRLDASKIADLYTSEAVLHNLYDNAPPTSLTGRTEITPYFSTMFNEYKAQGITLRLRFKIVQRRQIQNNVFDNGVYRLDILSPNAAPKAGFGRFSTVAQFDGQNWKFSSDATTNATFPEYDNVQAATIPETPTAAESESVLFAPFYDTFLGDYYTDRNECIVIGRSTRRLFAYFETTQQFRGLQKITTHRWKAGIKLLSNDTTQNGGAQEFRFHETGLDILEGGKVVIKAQKREMFKTEAVHFVGSNNATLAGTIFHPQKPSGKAIVLVHGSGAQDRNGYASIIRLLADILARESVTVLCYDKQGVGSSNGNWEVESFTDLAGDALAAMNVLRSRKDIRLKAIGLGGSSQAGWVMAKAVERSSNNRLSAVDFVLAIGAAGSGISVMEQNLYNTEIQMQCTKQFSPKQIQNALQQQRLFFEYILTRRNSDQFDRYTAELSRDSTLRDWLFPASKDIDLNAKNQWYTALEIGFNPLPVWRSYTKPALMLFGEFDDSTPTAQVQKNLEQLRKPNIHIHVLPKAQHLGLMTDSICREIEALQAFHPQFFAHIKQWLKTF